MTPRSSRRGAVLAVALRGWATVTAEASAEPSTRLVIREAPSWSEVGIQQLTDRQADRLLSLLRADLMPTAPRTSVQAAAAVDQILAEWRAEGRRSITVADWVAVLSRIGRDRQWLAAHLTHLADAGYLYETRQLGVYRLSKPKFRLWGTR